MGSPFFCVLDVKLNDNNDAQCICIYREGNDHLRLQMPYISEWVELIRKVPGRRWDGSRRVWLVPADKETVLIVCHVLTKIPVKIGDPIVYTLYPEFTTLYSLMNRKGYSMKTKRSYLGHAKRFLQQSKVAVNEVSREHLDAFTFLYQSSD